MSVILRQQKSVNYLSTIYPDLMNLWSNWANKLCQFVISNDSKLCCGAEMQVGVRMTINNVLDADQYDNFWFFIQLYK